MEKTIIGFLISGFIILGFKIIWDWLKTDRNKILIKDIDELKNEIKSINEKLGQLIAKLLDEFLKKSDFEEYKVTIRETERELIEVKRDLKFLIENIKSVKLQNNNT